jgi:hypothetical protein
MDTLGFTWTEPASVRYRRFGRKVHDQRRIRPRTSLPLGNRRSGEPGSQRFHQVKASVVVDSFDRFEGDYSRFLVSRRWAEAK